MKETVAPRISVVMPLYNCETYVGAAVESILNQTFYDFELIVVDDGSTDGGPGIVASYADPRIRLHCNGRNLGLVKSRNVGLAQARGEYVAILDSDDVADPKRLSRQVEFLESNPEFGLVGSWIELIDAQGSTKDVMRYPAGPEEIPPLLLFGNYFAQPSVCIRRSCLPPTWYREEFPIAEDYDLWVRMTANCKVWNLQEALTKYRVHATSITFAKAELLESCVRKIAMNQLALLQVQADSAELDLHRKIMTLRVDLDPEFIPRVESWLSLLLAANLKVDRYDRDAFARIVGQRWYMICREASWLGFAALRHFRSSRLYILAGVNWWQELKFFIRCLIRWQGKGKYRSGNA